jgi:hypothetical protein
MHKACSKEKNRERKMVRKKETVVATIQILWQCCDRYQRTVVGRCGDELMSKPSRKREGIERKKAGECPDHGKF